MTSLRITYRYQATNPICASCDAPVTGIEGRPSRLELSDQSALYAAIAWCRLRPCGHSFAVPRGGLIR
jgi:hypothetical protein